MEVLEFIRSIKTYRNSPLIFIYGAENYLIDSAISNIVADENVDFPEMNIDRLSSDAEVSAVIDAVYKAPMFAEKRLVILKDSEIFTSSNPAEQKAFVDMLTDIPETTKLVVSFFGTDDAKLADKSSFPLKKLDKRKSIYKTLMANAVIVNANRLAPDVMKKWMLNLAKKNGYTLTSNTADFICYICQPDMYSIMNEIEKLGSLAIRKPTEQDILSIASHTTEYSVFMFHDYMMRKDYEKAFSLLETIKSEEKNFIGLLGSLASKFRIMYMAKASLLAGYSISETANQIAKKAGIHPFAAKLAAQECRDFSIQTLRDSFKLILDCDVLQKSTGVMSTDEFKLFALKLYRGL